MLSVLDAWGNGLMAELRLKVLASGIVDFTAFSVEAFTPKPKRSSEKNPARADSPKVFKSLPAFRFTG